jgi:hypothetical protein
MNSLLRKVFDDEEFIEKVAYPTMKQFLGVTCPLTLLDFSLSFGTGKNILNHIVQQCLTKIFTYLICEERLVVIIENSQLMDEESWKVLLELKTLQARAFIVLLQKPIHFLNPSFTISEKTVDHSIISPNATIVFDWLEPYVRQVLMEGSTYLLLPPVSSKEIRYVLSKSLQVTGN